MYTVVRVFVWGSVVGKGWEGGEILVCAKQREFPLGLVSHAVEVDSQHGGADLRDDTTSATKQPHTYC